MTTFTGVSNQTIEGITDNINCTDCHDLIIQNNSVSSIYLNDCTGMTVVDNAIDGGGTELNGLVVNGGTGFQIARNDIHNIRSDLVRIVSAHNGVFEYNRLWDHIRQLGDHPDLVQFGCWVTTGPWANTCPSGWTFRKNIMGDDSRTGLDEGFGTYGQAFMVSGHQNNPNGYEDMLFEENLIYCGSGNSFFLDSCSRNVIVRNNTLLPWPGGWGAGIAIADRGGHGSQGLTVTGNIARTFLLDGSYDSSKPYSSVSGNGWMRNAPGDIGDPTHYLNVFEAGSKLDDPAQNPGQIWQDFEQKSTSVHAGLGAEAYLTELRTGSVPPPPVEPPMPDSITITSLDSIVWTPVNPGGTVIINPANDLTASPNDPDYVGDVAVTYTVTDTEGLTASSTWTHTFDPSSPVAAPDNTNGQKGTAITFDPKLNDTAD